MNFVFSVFDLEMELNAAGTAQILRTIFK